jgi:tetratricopeptide (TPR) repeat protein
MVDAGTSTTENLLIISQSYLQLRDCQNAVGWANKGIAAARRAGQAPKENFYLFKLQCASDARDNAAIEPVLVDLIRVNNRTSYWNTLLRIERQDERDDHNTLMIYRIMFNTQSMKEDSDFIEMAQLLGDAALPGEAAAVLGKAMSSSAIKDEHKERTSRLLASLQGRADADEQGLARLETEAARNPAGDPSVRLGEVYYGFGDYQKTVEAIAQGLQKDQIRHLDEAYVYLGLAQERLGNFTAAKQAFAGLRLVSNLSPRMLRLWDLYADGIGVPLTAAR